MSDLEQIESTKAAAVAALFYTSEDGRALPLNGEELHGAKLAAIDQEYHNALHEALAAAEAERAAAEELAGLAYQDKTAWLQPEELDNANRRAAFVREDLAAADVDTQINMARQAIRAGDKPLAWLMLRYLPQTAGDVASQSLGLAAELTAVLGDLERLAMPEATRTARQTSQERMIQAEQQRVKAKHAIWVANGRKGPFNPFS